MSGDALVASSRARETALARAEQKLSGAIDEGRGDIRGGKIALAVFFLGFLGWAAFAPLDAAVVASGVVVVSGNRQTVQHRDGGVVSRLNVVEGQHVRRNEILIELAAPEIVAQKEALLSQMFDLQMQHARLAAEIAGATSLQRPPEWSALAPEDQALANAAFARNQTQAEQGVWSEYGARISGYRQEIVTLARQESLLNDELAGMRQLADNHWVPLTRVRALERALAEIQGRRAELTASIAAAQQDRSKQLRDVDAKLAELTPQLVQAREQWERTRMRAPVDGVVVGLQMHTVGGVIRAGEGVMEIVPQDQNLIVRAQVRPEDADDVEAGQRTEVRITAFKGRNLPIVHGVVRQISADRFDDERSGRGYFLAEVAVPASETQALMRSTGRRIRPGLPAQVVIPTRKRTALSYLFEPLNQALWRSFREE